MTKNWFVVSNFWEFSKHHTGKQCSGNLYLLLKTKVKFATSELFSYKVLRSNSIKQIFCTETTSLSLFWDGLF